MKRVVIILMCMTLLFFGTTGCSQLSQEVKQTADDLYAAKVDFVGDNTAVHALIEKTGLGRIKDYTIQLETSQEPYGLIINITEKDGSFNESEFVPSAIQLLGLIKNLDYVEVNNGDEQFKMSSEEASALIDENVKTLGESKDKLKSIIEELTNK
ncbi:DUF4825 domain-containing protein [Acetobacterium malicum]|uniref:DUF4825 domain-containing protein n=1 Tax=Acetobacterium malicum TaxID=52692 RepID=UPI00359370A9